MVTDTQHNYPRTFDSPLPKNLDAERSTLGSLLFPGSGGRATLGTLMLTKHDFFDMEYQQIFQAMVGLAADFKPLDIQLLAEAIKRNGNWRGRGDTSPGTAILLAEISQSVPNAANVEHYAELVKETARKRRICQLGMNLHQSGLNGQTADELIAIATTDLDEIGAGGGRELCPAITAAELDLKEFKDDWLIDGVLVPGQPCVMAGPAKAMKTSILIDLAISLANAGFFLGKLKVNRPCRVAFYSGESGTRTIQETARRVCTAAGVSLADLGDSIYFMEKLPHFDNAEHIMGVRRFIAQHEIDVVMIDPAYLCLPGADAGNLFKQGEMLAPMTEAIGDAGATMILCHHYPKNLPQPYEPPELGNIAWSGFQEFARQWMLIGRRERYEPGTGDHRLWLNVGGSMGHSQLWGVDITEGVWNVNRPRRWDVDLVDQADVWADADDRKEAVAEQRVVKKLDSTKQNICNVMAAKFPAGETLKAIRSACGMNNAKFDPAFGKLIQSDDVVSCRVKKESNGHCYDGYKLAKNGGKN